MVFFSIRCSAMRDPLVVLFRSVSFFFIHVTFSSLLINAKIYSIRANANKIWVREAVAGLVYVLYVYLLIYSYTSSPMQKKSFNGVLALAKAISHHVLNIVNFPTNVHFFRYIRICIRRCSICVNCERPLGRCVVYERVNELARRVGKTPEYEKVVNSKTYGNLCERFYTYLYTYEYIAM